ncbi:MAG TPA: L,D-transpeptidase [Sporichthya sp.]|nr:L,D-transpeptidase [Sporichthya sp.]
MASKSFRATIAGLACTTLLGASLVSASPAEARSKMPRACYTGKIICIDKSDRVLRLLYNGRTLVRMDVRFGASSTPTHNGMFRVYWKDANHVSRLYGSAMPYSMFFSGGQAIHYSSDFARRGYAGASHGCVNVRDYSRIRTLFNSTPTGTRVYIYYW